MFKLTTTLAAVCFAMTAALFAAESAPAEKTAACTMEKDCKQIPDYCQACPHCKKFREAEEKCRKDGKMHHKIMKKGKTNTPEEGMIIGVIEEDITVTPVAASEEQTKQAQPVPAK